MLAVSRASSFIRCIPFNDRMANERTRFVAEGQGDGAIMPQSNFDCKGRHSGISKSSAHRLRLELESIRKKSGSCCPVVQTALVELGRRGLYCGAEICENHLKELQHEEEHHSDGS